MLSTQTIAGKILLPTITLLIILISTVLYYFSDILRQNTIETATTDAKSTLSQMVLQRQLYTESVVKKIKSVVPDAQFSTDHSNNDEAFPPPATLLHELSKLLSEQEGVTFKLYSPYPFANRADRTLTPFQQKAWDFFKNNPQEEFFITTERQNGMEVLRVAEADYMVSTGCTSCHNSHPDSPKTDWKVGDLRGILEVTTPITPQLVESRSLLVNVAIIFILGGAAIAALLIFVVKRVNNSLTEAVDLARELNGGNLTVKGKVHTCDEAGQVTVAINSVANSLHDSIAQVANSSHFLTDGTQHISESSKRIANDSNQQNDSLARISAMMQEVEAIMVKNTAHTEEATSLSMQAHRKAEEGTRQMGAMRHAMKEITESSTNISEIITTIEEIAFQTNILAINASVEAARAGQHGTGFAVVAQEVRNLALRSADAAKATTDLIENTASKVRSGAKITQETAAMLDEIMASSLQVVELMKEISKATAVQAQEVGNVNHQLNDLEALSKHNLDNSGNTATACEQLAREAQVLLGVVSRFKLAHA